MGIFKAIAVLLVGLIVVGVVASTNMALTNSTAWDNALGDTFAGGLGMLIPLVVLISVFIGVYRIATRREGPPPGTGGM